jgi:hypothetical protein
MPAATPALIQHYSDVVRLLHRPAADKTSHHRDTVHAVT